MRGMKAFFAMGVVAVAALFASATPAKAGVQIQIGPGGVYVGPNYNPYQYNPYQYNPYRYNPYQYNPYRYNPYRYNPYRYNPYQYSRPYYGPHCDPHHHHHHHHHHR